LQTPGLVSVLGAERFDGRHEEHRLDHIGEPMRPHDRRGLAALR